MKILFIKKHYNPYGGAELYLQKLAHHFSNTGKQIALLTSHWHEKTNFKVYTINLPPFLYSDLFFALKVKKIISQFNDYVIFSFDRTLSQHIYRASDGCHKKWLENRKKFLESFVKSKLLEFNPKHFIISWLEKKCLENSKIIITNSQMVKKEFQEIYGEKISQKCKVVYNGVDLKKFFPISQEEKIHLKKNLNLPTETPLILFVGSGYFRKGLIFLLYALSLIKDVFLIIIGKEKNLNFFKNLIKKLNLEKRVILIGKCKEPIKFYQSADIFVLPTIYDPFSNACLEALACGLPVITTNANGCAEIIKDAKNGFVLHLPLNMEELAYKIEFTLNNLKKMKNYAIQTAKTFPIEKSVEQIIKIIQDCLSSK